MKLDTSSLLTVFFSLSETDIFQFIQINKKCFNVSQCCLVNPCRLNKKIFHLLNNLQTLSVKTDDLKEIDSLSQKEKERFKSYPFVWRISINSNNLDNKRNIWDIINLKKIRKLVIACEKVPDIITECLTQMDELTELKLLVEFVPMLLSQIQQLALKKLVIYVYQKNEEINYNLLLNHPTCKNIIVYSIFDKDVIEIKTKFPSLTVVFQSNYLPTSIKLANLIVQRKIYLSIGHIRLDSSELEVNDFQELQRLYLPAFNISDCQPLTVLPQTYCLEIDTYFPEMVCQMTCLKKFVFFEKLGYFPNHYDFSHLTQLTSLVLYGNYQRKRKIFIPTSLECLESSCFVDNTNNIILNKKKGLQHLNLKQLSLRECEVIKLGGVVDDLVLINCWTENILNCVGIKKVYIKECPVKTVIVSSQCQHMSIECDSLQCIKTLQN
ncbi:hypothetical protein EHI8A_106540 [Entamoeba histolytica HM-1:IMSS-B]|uniref:Uncharacterized protein n=6 Tax=Entamoeba histolytica TaxID=5759 RepID=C4LTU1_ENTH1|nr:hypothetical protein EHI_050710 [Entamoeba histolytica HM-1:IMSS]EMD47584.1 Hypothetical protein EHI5A_029340 [Entamoeba histolytica KU27]EMH72130.1 hypothetical protein EHI8A_106540 [Entamoeba histolytica HM-1:IMSS-B]EMS11839.1 hypothetical protein KM1_035370 [Entamoeba histolytica HM-3:IMSS]ENY64008.1 hypothetical protein EHI7A_015840 [Entamoeba histolytica HM-1:IMSS-A]GAT92000.1 hypothetical protein CL6EHI_050710 [Entamoeba histolytica]|eukprot:XP_656589.1 hypothetical protein EHI_050710 [Entamoeba histolytica HM-1:IMSS]